MEIIEGGDSTPQPLKGPVEVTEAELRERLAGSGKTAEQADRALGVSRNLGSSIVIGDTLYRVKR